MVTAYEVAADMSSAWQEHLYKEMTARYTSLHNNARNVIDGANTEIAELQKQLEGGSISCHAHQSVLTTLQVSTLRSKVQKNEQQR